MALPNMPDYTSPDGAPESFGDFAEWIKRMMESGAFTGDFDTWDPSTFNDRADETYGSTMGIAEQFREMASGRDQLADIEAARQRQINAEYMGRSGVTGSAALNQMNRTEGELAARQQQWRKDALGGALGAFGQAFGIGQGTAQTNQAGVEQNNQWEQQGVENNFGIADIMSMFPAFDIQWETTGGGGMSEEDMRRLWEQWMAQQQQQQSGSGSGGDEPHDGSTG